MVNTLTDSPISTHTLAQDQPLMEENNKYYAHTLVVDHQIGDATPGLSGGRTDAIAKEGYHKVVHFVTNVGDPAVIATVGQLYTKTVGADVALFYESALGVIQQLTTNVTPIVATNGKSFLPGGIIIQWGSAGATADGTLVNFATAFPTTLFSLTVAHSQAGAGENPAIVVSAVNKTTSGFNLRCPLGAASYSYIAIGN